MFIGNGVEKNLKQIENFLWLLLYRLVASMI